MAFHTVNKGFEVLKTSDFYHIIISYIIFLKINMLKNR
jgi:hypothetical protein